MIYCWESQHTQRMEGRASTLLSRTSKLAATARSGKGARRYLIKLRAQASVFIPTRKLYVGGKAFRAFCLFFCVHFFVTYSIIILFL